MRNKEIVKTPKSLLKLSFLLKLDKYLVLALFHQKSITDHVDQQQHTNYCFPIQFYECFFFYFIEVVFTRTPSPGKKYIATPYLQEIRAILGGYTHFKTK
jgi:hypothetical protein